VFVAEQGTERPQLEIDTLGILIGPEGGWSEAERSEFARRNLPHLALGDFTLRAETAAVIAAGQLLQKNL
jgi:RsmE family RNA methyltransferase